VLLSGYRYEWDIAGFSGIQKYRFVGIKGFGAAKNEA
jgi:hypothetical protein